ncbi:heme/hemin ABC transporter substrate-binding protein [Pyruvatibacter mobilis]|nr:ABC transporter substrate-binding protein [Pyruvatibacter mobilis]GGD17125.1 hemin ABC transporter substrate-binding protein [Pyruvatibacter mobilis]
MSLSGSMSFFMSRRVRSALAGVLAAVLTGAGPHAVAAEAPERIISVGGAVTETLFALGLGDRIVAVDSTSLYPAEATALPQVGYLRQLSSEGVLAQRPDMVLLGEGAGPASAVEQITNSGLAVENIAIGWSPESVTTMIRKVGDATGAGDRAGTLADSVAADFAALADAVPQEDGPTVLLVISAGAGPLLGAGTHTAAEVAISLAGGRLALPTLEGYKPLSLEPVLAADPDYIIVPSHVVEILGGMDGLRELDVIAETNAGRNGRIIIADSLYLLGFGPRAPQAAADLARIFHPDADIPLESAGGDHPLIQLAK